MKSYKKYTLYQIFVQEHPAPILDLVVELHRFLKYIYNLCYGTQILLANFQGMFRYDLVDFPCKVDIKTKCELHRCKSCAVNLKSLVEGHTCLHVIRSAHDLPIKVTVALTSHYWYFYVTYTSHYWLDYLSQSKPDRNIRILLQ